MLLRRVPPCVPSQTGSAAADTESVRRSVLRFSRLMTADLCISTAKSCPLGSKSRLRRPPRAVPHWRFASLRIQIAPESESTVDIIGIGYLGFETAKLEEWRSYGPEVMGFRIVKAERIP